MLTIYGLPLSGYCAKVRVVLRHKSLDWQQLPPPGGYKTDAYRQVVPSGNLPALVDGDVLLADSEAINEYLNEQYPEPALLPADPIARAKTRERSRFHDTRLEPELRKLYPYLRPDDRDTELNQRQSAEISTRLAQMARMLGEAPADTGETLTLGNIAHCFTFAWIDVLTPILGLEIHWPKEVLAFRKLLAAHPSIDAELQPYGAALTAWLDKNGVT